jgi:type IV secretion system protein VirB5
MKGRIVTVVAALAVAGEARGQMAVFDSSNFGQLVAQARTLSDQVRQLERTYNALSGVRGFGDVLYDPQLREYLPADWARVYDEASGGAYGGISGTLAAIRMGESGAGTVDEMEARIVGRSRRTALTDKAVGLQGYAGARARLAQIEALMRHINQTQDPKGIQELQARLAVEQAAVQNEATKLQLVAMLQRAEERLVEQQKSEQVQRILGGKDMPTCCSSQFSPK